MRIAMAIGLVFVSISAGAPGLEAAAGGERQVYLTRRADVAPVLDGRLDDAAWQSVEWSGEFVQREPADGQPPTRQTRFKVLYDDHALYFGFRAFDDPKEVASLLARRDRFPGDWIEVNIDSYFDHRSAFSFTLSLSGTRGDEFISKDGDRWDSNWDPVWQGVTQVDDEGWTAEIRIPLSQLRFSGAEKQTWGLQATRRLFRKEERSTWQAIPKNVSGWVSRFGELRGLDGLRPRRRLELLPYGLTRAERFEAETGNPFRDGGSADLSAGLDGKVGLTSNLTVDFTLNPDFGQVEADPSQVNLTAFETFFSEKRPFFIEGNDIFDLPLAPAITGGSFTGDRLFYSRRIGGRPQRSPDIGDGEFADVPTNTSILGAFKLSGKTAGGLSVGVLEALTGGESARVDRFGERRHEPVAPLTNSFVGRVQQNLRGGDTQLGLMLTTLHRGVEDSPLDFLTGQAYAGGFDFAHYFNHRAFIVEGNVLGSRVQGSTAALADVQTSSARYFQRPDNDQAHLDPTRTSLSGQAGSVRLGRPPSTSRVRFQTGVAWRSPGFEINDLGFMRAADEINQFGWADYELRNPFSIFRNFFVNVNEWLDWDFGGHFLRAAANTNFNTRFRNNYGMGAGVTRSGETLSNTELRGGPASKWPAATEYEAWASSDSRQRFSVGLSGYWRRADQRSESTDHVGTDLSYRPTNALTFTLSPSYDRSRREMQYVSTPSLGGQDRFVFGRIDQQTFALTVRADLSLTPNLTVQYYGSPFVSSGTYREFKRITDPRARAYADRFALFGPGQIALDAAGVYQVDENRDGVVDYRFDRPDFDVREFNSNLVVRWEYRPGSLVYLVWSQGRSDGALALGDFAVARGLRDIFRVHPHDVFLIKFSRWFSR
jgi:uncharacterized protein DUF5916/cellulose/xylan binding protein with CBM9 domain